MMRLALFLTMLAAPAALADAPLMVLDRTQLPFDLGPGTRPETPRTHQPHRATAPPTA